MAGLIIRTSSGPAVNRPSLRHFETDPLDVRGSTELFRLRILLN